MKRRGRRWTWIVAGAAFALLPVAVTGYQLSADDMRRFYVYGLWWEAYHHFREERTVAPTSLADMETLYNTYDRCKGQLPYPSVPPPLYRPPPDDSTAYIVLLEPERQWHARRNIYRAIPGDRHLKCESVWKWRVPQLVREDDQRRRTAMRMK